MALHGHDTPNKLAVVFEDQQISWQELWQQVENASYFFAGELGNEAQEVVGLLMTNSLEFVIAYLAVLHAGHIAAPIDPVYKKLEIDAIVKQLDLAMVVMQERYDDQITKEKAARIFVASSILKNKYQPALCLRLPAIDQVASLTFTSGTSGKPKTVPNTHANQIWSVEVCSKVWDWTSQDSLLITLPLSHWYGLVMGLAGAVYHGNILYLRQQSFDAKAILEGLADGQVSIFTHTPLGYMKMLEQPGDYDLSEVRLFISGSAPLPPSLWHQFKKRFGIEILETYGSSETGRIAANSRNNSKLGSAGRILPTVDFKLSKEGEVLIKSGGVCPGYWDNSEATAQATTTDGYWRTGDIGELKDDYLILKGRTQERIRRFGYTISPRDIEWALLENPKIKQALVLGQQQAQQANDRLIYFIVGSVSSDEVSAYSKANLPFNWRADHIFILDSIPRNTSGKPKLAELKQMAMEPKNV